MSAVPGQLRAYARRAQVQGWVITRYSGGHLKWQPPGGRAVFTPVSPSGGNRSVDNVLAKLRRAGLK